MPKPQLPDGQLVVTDHVTPEIQAALIDGLNAFNDEITGYGDRLPLAVVVRDPVTGSVLGGAAGRSSLGLLFLDMFYLPPSYRGAGLGRAIIAAFEEEGRRRGCVSGVVNTISFQAPGFYERCGWRRFGEVACLPPGTSRVFLSKVL